MDLLTLGGALLAGVLTFLNPCVLPVLPLVFGAAANEHRFGPLALAAGLALAFTAVGLFVATLGVSLGLDPGLFRLISAGLLVLFGLILLIPRAQAMIQKVMGPVGAWAAERSQAHNGSGVRGQFGLGLLLGAVWSPCVGPTLGAATVLAGQSGGLGPAALTMLVFGLGAAAPLLLIGAVLRGRMAKLRQGFGAAGRMGRIFLGAGMLLAGLLVLTGLDKALESLLLDVSPEWLINLTTSI